MDIHNNALVQFSIALFDHFTVMYGRYPVNQMRPTNVIAHENILLYY